MIHRHRPRAAIVVAAVGLLYSYQATAQTSATPLDPVVVTASRTSQPLPDALPATTVITRADIEDSLAPDVPTLLRSQAGFDVAQSGGLGSQTSLFLRGSNSNQVLVLVDGLRINAVESGAASIAHLMIDQIDHIEIVRGNVSSLYGSEAIGGVVQIFTRGGVESDGGVTVGASGAYGSERTRAASADVSQSFGPDGLRTDYGVSASYRSQKGFSAIDTDRVAAANPDYDGYRNSSVSAHLAQHVGDNEVGFRYFESYGHLDFDESTDYVFDDPSYNGRVQTQSERSRQTDASLYARLKPLAPWTVDLTVGQARDLSANTASFPFSFVIGTAVSRQRQYRIDNAVRLDAHVITLGVERLDQTGFSTSYGDGIDGATFSRHVDSVTAGYTGPLFLSPTFNEFQFNARHDRYSDFGDATTGLAAYGFKFAKGWKAIAEVSNAFRAPSFNELYFPFFGNPALKAERARSVEAAVQYASDGTLARVSAFATHTRNLIVFDPNLELANNIDRASVKGVELTGRTSIAGWLVTTNVTLDRPIDADTGQRLLRRSTHAADVAIAKSFGRWRFSGDVQAAGSRPDSEIETSAPTTVAGYGVVNLGLRYEIVRGTSVGVAVTNAFDRRYELVDGYQTAGRISMATIATRY